MTERYTEDSKYTKVQLQEMASAFVGMLHANVDHRPRDVVFMLAHALKMSPQIVWQNINALANMTYQEA